MEIVAITTATEFCLLAIFILSAIIYFKRTIRKLDLKSSSIENCLAQVSSIMHWFAAAYLFITLWSIGVAWYFHFEHAKFGPRSLPEVVLRNQTRIGWSFCTRQMVGFIARAFMDFPLIIPNLYYQYKNFSKLDGSQLKSMSSAEWKADHLKQ